ncbi:MAG: hypothetical protein E7627_05880 [Ruminococcaceae bacterium]|nr:hypothetical protein [Oscillospiraceae bacterium]
MNEQDVQIILREKTRENEPIKDPPVVKRKKVTRIICQALPILLTAVSVTFFAYTAISILGAVQLDKIFVTRTALGRIVGGTPKVQYIKASENLTTDKSQLPGIQFADVIIPGSSALPSPNSPAVEDYTISLNNETPYSPDMSEILNSHRAISPLDELLSEYGSDAPIVLIIHTHGSEGYSDSADSSYRTEDKSKNVVAIGKIIADKLNAAGISTIHCDTLFDAEDFNMAYYNASLEIRRVLKEYPSVSYIIDVHRDSVELSDGTHYPLKAEADGHIAAQLMFVVGTDHGGSGHTGWRDNLSLAARIQYSIGTGYPALMRNVNLRSASFNQQYTKGSLILEVGSSGNTLDEAKISADIFANALIREIKGY